MMGVPADLKNPYSMHITAAVNVPKSGSWTFHLESNDGSVLVVDGTPIISNDGVHVMKSRSGTVELAAGMHEIVVDFFEAGGSAGLRLLWEADGVHKQPVPATALFSKPLYGVTGYFYLIKRRMYRLPQFKGRQPRKAMVVDTVDFPITTEGKSWPGLNIEFTKQYLAQFKGYVNVTKGGTWRFYTQSSDGSRLYIDGRQVNVVVW